MKKLFFYTTVFFFAIACKKEVVPVSSSGQTPKINYTFEEPASISASRQSIITDPTIPVGWSAAFDDKKLYMLASGPKDKSGKLTALDKIIVINSTNQAWIRYEFGTDYLPQKAEISTGFLINYSNYNSSKFTVDIVVTKKADNKEVFKQAAMPIYEGNFELATKAKNFLATGVDYAQARIRVCDRKWGAVGAGAYIGANIAGCITAGIALLAAPELGIFATLSAGNAAASACSESKKLLDNIQNNRPAFECPEAGAADRECFSNIVSETGQALQNCGQAVANNWLSKKACECNDETMLGPALPLGSGHGDPHLNTYDGLTYDFMAVGEFTLSQSTADKLLVQIRCEPATSTTKNLSSTTSIALRFDKEVLQINAKPFKVFLNGQVLPDGFGFRRLSGSQLITQSGSEIRYLNNAAEEIIIKANAGHLDYVLQLNPSRKGKLKGLLGNMDGSVANDIMLANGTIVKNASFSNLYPNYANDWRVKKEESLFTYDAGKNTESYNIAGFPNEAPSPTSNALLQAESKCKAAGVNREPYLSACIYDLANTNDDSYAQSAKWGQSLASFTSLPVGSDIWYHQNVRIEVGPFSTFQGAKNILDLDKAKTYTYNEAINNKDVDVLAFNDITSNLISCFEFARTSGFTGALGNLLKQLNWTNYTNTSIYLANGSDVVSGLKVTNQQFYNVQTSADINNLLASQLKKYLDSQRANTNNALENFEKGIDRQHVFVFRTDAGKLGLMRIVAAGIQTSNGFNYYDLDIKIQK